MSEEGFFFLTLWGSCTHSDGDLLAVWLRKGPECNLMVNASNHDDNYSTGCNHQWQCIHVCVHAWLWLSGLLNLSLNATKVRMRVRDPGGILLMTNRGLRKLEWDSRKGSYGSCVAMVTKRQSACCKETEEYLLTMFLQFEPNTQNQNAENWKMHFLVSESARIHFAMCRLTLLPLLPLDCILHLKAVQIDILTPCRETKSKSCGRPPDQQSDAVGPRMKLFKCNESNWPCTEPEQYWAEALRQGSRTQLVSGTMQTDSGQMTHQAEQCQAILGGAAGRAGNASQHLSTVLHVSDLCDKSKNGQRGLTMQIKTGATKLHISPWTARIMSACSIDGRIGPGRSCRNCSTPQHRDSRSSCSRSEKTNTPVFNKRETSQQIKYKEERRNSSPASASCRTSKAPALTPWYTPGASRPAENTHRGNEQLQMCRGRHVARTGTDCNYGRTFVLNGLHQSGEEWRGCVWWAKLFGQIWQHKA